MLVNCVVLACRAVGRRYSKGGPTMGVFVAIDTGGTFTDLVTFDASRQSVRYTKSLTTHDNPIDGIFACVDKAKVSLNEAELFKHGTTLVINTLLERSGPQIAVVATRGFRDLLDFGRGNRTEPFNLFYRREPPLASREYRFEICERIDARGKVVEEPNRVEVEEIAARLRALDVASVAVAFMNSYINPVHEQTVAGWLRELLPSCYITTGSELTREWYEFERTATAAVNAYVGPKIGRYVGALDRALKQREFYGQLLMMGSNGGVLSVQHSAAAPILLVESGPVGGCIGAGAYASALATGDLIAFDMGGTTAKCALVKNGGFEIQSTYYIGGYGRGVPVRAPVVDIVEVGAGGGSIAWIDQQNHLRVGPRSAGSQPGPVSYGRGGLEPTVTDANLVLGRIGEHSFQGGEMTLDSGAALKALSERLGQPLGYRGEKSLLELAAGIVAITNVRMGEAIKRITVQRGEEPSDFKLFAYGGGGPLHAADLARELRIPVVIIPPEAGNFSAIGMLLANIRRDDSRTFLRRLNPQALSEMDDVFRNMEAEMRARIETDFGSVDVSFERIMEIRYVGQYHTVRVPAREETAAQLADRFRDIYRARYGHAPNTVAEFVSLHCTATASTPQPDILGLAGDLLASEPAITKTRPVYFPEAHDYLDTKVFARSKLPRGFTSKGPAVIEEYGSTTLVGPSDRFEIGRLGEIRIMINDARG
jgi:N-methylhydantoinase A